MKLFKFWKLFFILFLLLSLPITKCFAEIDLKEFTNKYENATLFITTYDDKGRKLSAGSGFFINAEGDFVTNRHVLKGAVSIAIETSAGEKYTFGQIKAIRPDLDLVIASVSAVKQKTAAHYLHIAKTLPDKGERVIVFGNPLQAKFSVSEGIVSGIQTFPNAEWPQLTQLKGTYIQFTAPVSSGSSGGPILNEEGQVVGVTTWGFTPAHSQNMNFAIPADSIHSLIATANSSEINQEPAYDDDMAEKKQVGVVVMYGPVLLKELKKPERINEITQLIENAVSAKFRPNKYNLELSEKMMPYFITDWKYYSGLNKEIQLEDVDKPFLVEFAQIHDIDVLVFAGVEMLQSKKQNNLFYAGSAVEVEIDLRVLNKSLNDYSYAKIFEGVGSHVSQKFWGWESPNMIKPVLEATNSALRYFRREFSAEQIL